MKRALVLALSIALAACGKTPGDEGKAISTPAATDVPSSAATATASEPAFVHRGLEKLPGLGAGKGWALVSVTGSRPTRHVYFAQVGRVNRLSGDIRRMWTGDFEENWQAGPSYTIVLHEFDCRNQTIKALQFLKRDNGGSSLQWPAKDGEKPAYVVPSSNGERWLELACGSGASAGQYKLVPPGIDATYYFTENLRRVSKGDLLHVSGKLLAAAGGKLDASEFREVVLLFDKIADGSGEPRLIDTPTERASFIAAISMKIKDKPAALQLKRELGLST